MITERDQKMINHAEKYGLTVKQCAKLFYPGAYGETNARKRLKILYDNKALKRYRVWDTNEYVYGKDCSRHQIYRMDFYAALSGFQMLDFKPEFHIYNVVPDAYFRFLIGKVERVIFLEVDINNKTKVQKYEDLYIYHRDEIKKTLGVFPQIIIMSNNKFNYNGQLLISHINLRLDGLIELLV